MSTDTGHETSDDQADLYPAHTGTLIQRLRYIVSQTWDLGLMAFGGPASHILVFRRRFVECTGKQRPWLNDAVYQELFSLSQATPGPASTKLLFWLVWIRAGPIPAIVAFFMWSLPGALAMMGFALGVQRIDTYLPDPVYALLTGLNAATVGVIAAAAVDLATKAVKDPLSRLLIIFGGCAGLCYSSYWYFPVLISIGGITTLVWDLHLGPWVTTMKARWARRKATSQQAVDLEAVTEPARTLARETRLSPSEIRPASIVNTSQSAPMPPKPRLTPAAPAIVVVDTQTYAVKKKVGAAVFFIFLSSLIILVAVPRTLKDPPRPGVVISNIYLAGTIVFGGGPVLIPLMSNYVVDPGWVSPRNFLLGLAVIQAMPGPNFNFAVYLGALSMLGTGYSVFLGAFIGFVGVFLPGMTVAVASLSMWRIMRERPTVVSVLRGINSTAVGLVFTAVYRLWRIGVLRRDTASGVSLESDPWWTVITAVTYAAITWFKIPIPVAILFGGVLGLGWYGVVTR